MIRGGETDPLVVIHNKNKNNNNINDHSGNARTAAASATTTTTNNNDMNDESDGKRKKTKRRMFTVFCGSLRFYLPSKQTMESFIKPGQRVDAWCGLAQYCVEYFIYLLGPLLILLASSIIALLVYSYFTIFVDMLHHYYKDVWYGPYIIFSQTCFVMFLLVNVTTNYALCVVTSNIKGTSYDTVMREMALATGFQYPETPQEVEQFRQDYEDRMLLRMRCRRQRAIEAANRQIDDMNNNNNINNINNHNNNNVTQRKNVNQTTTTTESTVGPGPVTVPVPTPVPVEPSLRPWMMMGPLEWGFCNRTNQPKPPRAHYCHVSKGLVFCLDHYCPWMFSKSTHTQKSIPALPFFVL